MVGSGQSSDGRTFFRSQDAPDPEVARAAFAAVPGSDPALIQPGDEIKEDDSDKS